MRRTVSTKTPENVRYASADYTMNIVALKHAMSVAKLDTFPTTVLIANIKGAKGVGNVAILLAAVGLY